MPTPRLTSVTLAAALLLPLLAGCVGDSGATENRIPAAVERAGRHTSATPPAAPAPPAPSFSDDNDNGPPSESLTPAAQGGFSNTSVFPGKYDRSGRTSRPLEPGAHGIGAHAWEYLASDVDGAAIQIRYTLPDHIPSGGAPVILVATPYFARGPLVSAFPFYDDTVATFVPHGYAVAVVAVRGTGDSGGCVDLNGRLEQEDVSQAITWLGTRAWSNGNVGMTGLSSDGSTAWMAAATGNPHLRTIVPVSGVNDQYALMYKNGTAEGDSIGAFNAGYYVLGFTVFNPLTGRQATRMAEAAACPGAAEGFAGSAFSGAGMGRHRYWAERNHRPGVESNYTGSIFVVHGLQDWNVDPSNAYPWVNELEARGLVVKHLLGQWDHKLPDVVGARMDYAEILLRWFDYWLKEDTTRDLGPRVQVQSSDGKWRNENAWPPRDARARVLYLTGDGRLAHEPDAQPVAARSTLTTAWLGLGDCHGCIRLRSQPLASELRFAGIPQVHVTVTPSGPGGSLAAQLYAVEGERRTLLGHGSLDFRFAEGSEEPRAVQPGQPLDLRIWMEPLDVAVPKGAALELELTQEPWGDRNPSAPFTPADVHFGTADSRLILHAFERDASAFFVPPRR